MTWRLHPSYIQFIWYGEPYSLADWRHKLHSWANSSSFHAHNSYLEACSWFSDMLISPKAQHGFYREFVFWGEGMSALWWCQVESGFNLIWQTAVLCKYHSRDLLCLCGAPVAHPSRKTRKNRKTTQTSPSNCKADILLEKRDITGSQGTWKHHFSAYKNIYRFIKYKKSKL